MASSQLLIISIPWWFSEPFDSVLRFTNLQIFIFLCCLLRYFKHQVRYCISPIIIEPIQTALCSNNFIYHSNFHYHNKSSTDHRQQFRIILQSHQINAYMIAYIPFINKTNNCIYWWMWFHNRLSSNKQQYDFTIWSHKPQRRNLQVRKPQSAVKRFRESSRNRYDK